MSKPTRFNLPLLLAPLALVALGACSPRDDHRTAGEKLDSAISTVEQKTDSAKADADRKMDEAKQSMSETAKDVKSGAAEMTDKVANTVSDASITAAVNAELAKDSKLSAIKINVDTKDGYVTLKGTAPDSLSQDRATTLAASVKGVRKVDNQLMIAGG